MTPPPPPPPPGSAPEAVARVLIDAAFAAAGWVVQDRADMNLAAARGVAVREFKLKQGHGYADYLLFVDGKAVGVLEAKHAGHTLSGVEPQSSKYAAGLPDGLNPPVQPLPFLYLSTGAITKFTSLLDPHPRSRVVFHIHRPQTLADWLAAPTLDAWRATTLGHLVLGSGFDPRDLVAYALGVFAGWRLEIAARQRQRQRVVALPPVVRRMKSGVAERASAPGPRGRRRRTRVMRGP